MPSNLIAITVNYCSADVILDGLDEVVRQIREIDGAAFWIVDNQSPDGSAHVLQEAIAEKEYNEHVKIISAGANGGFGAGNNVAIQKGLSQETPPEYFYFLNPDAVPKPGAIMALLSFMEGQPDAGIAGGCLCDEDGEIQSSFFRFPSFFSELESAVSLGFIHRLLKRHTVTLEVPKTPEPVDWVAGTSFIARRAAFETAGLFDETFFLYWEEVELCHRIQNAGFKIYGVPEAVVMHIGGVSTGMHDPEKRIPPYWFASRNHFFRTTGLVRNIMLMNVTVACALMVQRTHLAFRSRPLTPPHFLRDFVTYSLLQTNRDRQKSSQ